MKASRISAPNVYVLEVAEKLMRLIGYEQFSWSSFQRLMANFSVLKESMQGVVQEGLSELQVTSLITIWRDRNSLVKEISSSSICISLLVIWMSECVEYNMKKENLRASKSKIPDLQHRIKLQMARVAQKSTDLQNISKQLDHFRGALEQFESEESRCVTDDFMSISINSHAPSLCDPKSIINSPSLLTPTAKRNNLEFPRFDKENLYQETYSKNAEDEAEVEFEGANEIMGCCKSKFFCF
jgi:hypothetical protein